MSLNYLLHRHQISIVRSEAGRTPEARAAHRGLAAGYAARIQSMRTQMGARVSTPHVS